ncbi:MAG: hypothetical protein AB7U79_05355 [Candidatus Izemoplasmatales bacterium]
MSQSLNKKIVFIVLLYTPFINFLFLSVLMLNKGLFWSDYLPYLALFVLTGLVSIFLSILYIKKVWDDIEEMDPFQYGKSLIRLAIYQSINTVVLLACIMLVTL